MDTRNNPIIIDGNNGRPETRFGYPQGQTAAASSLLSRVLLITSVGFLVSAFGVALAPAFYSPAMFWVYVIASFLLIFAVRATRRTPLLSLGLFLLLTLVLGFEIAPWIQYLLHNGQTDMVFNAALTTAVGMGCLGIGAQMVSFNYRRVGNIALAGLLALVLVGILGAFFHFVNPTVYSWLTLLVFSVLTVVDFARIRAGGEGATAIELALSIYLDGLNLFMALTQIFSGGRSRR